jgi:hypothetical protein
MRKLADIPNTDAPSTNYPGGRIRNKNNSTVPPIIGTPIVEELYGDMVQFFQRLLVMGSVTPNDLPDNVTNGYQTIQALFSAILAQFAANVPESEYGTATNKFLTPEMITARDAGLITEIWPINDWDMNAINLKILTFPGRYIDRIRSIDVLIRNDANTELIPLLGASISFTETDGTYKIDHNSDADQTELYLFRRASGFFDTASYQATSYNRGFVRIQVTQPIES